MTSPASSDDLGALRASTGDGSLELLYQPEVDLPTGAVVAMEGLLRCRHPERGLLEPAPFLELAAMGDGLSRLGAWVLREGVAEAVRWSELPGPTRRLWLNVSGGELVAPGFVEMVAGLVEDSGLRDDAIGLELAESCVVDLGHAARPLLDGLRAAGVALAVDNFSSWYATLGAIQMLPIDVVKLCQEYVRAVDTLDGRRIIAMIVERAHSHGLSVVAEGVESWTEAVALTELGCDRAHGWLYASAMRADKARWLLEHGAGWQAAGVPLPVVAAEPAPEPVVPVPAERIGFVAPVPAARQPYDLLAPLTES